MAQHYENKSIDDALELLTTNGFDGRADAVTVLLNSAVVAAQRIPGRGTVRAQCSTYRLCQRV